MKRYAWILVVMAACAGRDEGGCPIDPEAAIGERCPREGAECGEVSLCDPCTSDLSQCVMIACTKGQWTSVEVDPTCPE